LEDEDVCVLKVQVFSDITPYRLVITVVLKDCSPFIVRVSQPKKRGLLDPEDGGTTIFRNARKFVAARTPNFEVISWLWKDS